ncbi:hypothetical protein [Rhodovarius lipocyclicus]|uniref:hypothetical protein n=1 Tax=Rhodovarius lipocyclicus TaxID=268410 RepID=UPI001359B470|nr:hypothetical protein [Rhodovarius lipocyclicus]
MMRVQHQRPEGWKGGTRHEGDSLRRFAAVLPHADRTAAALSVDHPALAEARTIFPSTVHFADEVDRVLVSGANNPKLGARVTKGPWRGMPIYQLTLEERATCPASCALWATCYGNSMHLARRHRPGRELEQILGAELCGLADRHPGGFVVRLHTLGDFYSVRYASLWAVWLQWIPELRVFGYTAREDGTPIAEVIERLNGRFPDRCLIRFSRAVPSGKAHEAITIWHQPAGQWVDQGLVCPAQTERTACCGTCGLCWSPAMAATPIVFVGHGRRTKRRVAA